MDPDRTPVLVGLGEVVNRPDDGTCSRPRPDDRRCDQAGGGRCRQRAAHRPHRRDRCRAVRRLARRRSRRPRRRAARDRSLPPRDRACREETARSSCSTCSPRGSRRDELDVGVVCGGEALFTQARAARNGGLPDWTPADPGRSAGEVVEGEQDPGTDAEREVGIIAPIMAYPLIENAIGHAAGETVDRAPAGASPTLWSRLQRGRGASSRARGRRQAYTPEELIARRAVRTGSSPTPTASCTTPTSRSTRRLP